MTPRSSGLYFLALKDDAYQQLNATWNNFLASDYSLLNFTRIGLYSLAVKCLLFA